MLNEVKHLFIKEPSPSLRMIMMQLIFYKFLKSQELYDSEFVLLFTCNQDFVSYSEVNRETGCDHKGRLQDRDVVLSGSGCSCRECRTD